MDREEIAARLRALANHSAPWKLGDEPNVAWRVACRQAADHFEALARVGIASEKRGEIAPPTAEEISAYRDLFRLELDKRMDTKHPSASPSTEAHAMALRRFVERRNDR